MYKFDPLSSLTVYDLARLIAALDVKIGEHTYENLPEDLRKHFRPVEKSQKEPT